MTVEKPLEGERPETDFAVTVRCVAAGTTSDCSTETPSLRRNRRVTFAASVGLGFARSNRQSKNEVSAPSAKKRRNPVKVNAPAAVTDSPSGFVTITSTGPASADTVVARISVSVTDCTVAAVRPSVTVAPVKKLWPAIVSAVPPPIGPWSGEMLVKVGGAR